MYAEKKGTRKSVCVRGRRSQQDVYDDDFEEPFAPRRESGDDGRRSSIGVDWDKRREAGDDGVEGGWELGDDWLD